VTSTLGPRLVVAGVASGVGKTTIATGLMAALRARGMQVANAKVGPDFIDPGYHCLATGRPARNLDSWICGEEAIARLAGRAAAGADILVVEGVMGLFDGAADGQPEASTASIARLLHAPVILVVDASAMSGSVAAVVHGYCTFDPSIRVAGVVLNRVGSPGHETLLREALNPLGIPVLGALRRDDSFTWRDRHLGLIPVVEASAETRRSIARLAAAIRVSLDLADRRPTSRSMHRPSRAGSATPGSPSPPVLPSASSTRTTLKLWRQPGRSCCPLTPATTPVFPMDRPRCTPAVVFPRSSWPGSRTISRYNGTCAPRRGWGWSSGRSAVGCYGSPDPSTGTRSRDCSPPKAP